MEMEKKIDPGVFHRPIIKKENLILENKPILVGLDSKSSSAEINLKKEGNIVKIIQVICRCGNKIEIVCEYEDENAPNS